MVRKVETTEAHGGFGGVEPAAIDLDALAHHARNDAEPGGDTRAREIDRQAQYAVEQRGVEFVGRAVDVDEDAREKRHKQRRAACCDPGEQFLDIGVLRAAQGQRRKPGLGQKALGIEPARMGRGENEGRALHCGAHDSERLGPECGKMRLLRRLMLLGSVHRPAFPLRPSRCKVQWTTKFRHRSSAALTGIYGLTDIRLIWWGRSGRDMAQILLVEDDKSLRKFLAAALLRPAMPLPISATARKRMSA